MDRRWTLSGLPRRAGVPPTAQAVAVNDQEMVADGLVAHRAALASAGHFFRFISHHVLLR